MLKTRTPRRAKTALSALVAIVLFGVSLTYLSIHRKHAAPNFSGGSAKKPKLYWFIPDGLRADPDLFQLFRWAQEGKLPNIKRLMAQGSYGYSIPVFPSHTPVNFAALFTGVGPLRNGVADGAIRSFGFPLNMVSTSGFSSLAKTIDPFWLILERAGLVSTLLSIPGSTPPEITNGNVIKGRWGNWGIEFPSILFHTATDRELKRTMGWNDRVFGIEKQLTDFIRTREPSGWAAGTPKSFSPAREVNLRNWGTDLFALIVDSTDDGRENYDTLVISRDKKELLAVLKDGAWSDWFKLALFYETGRQYQKNAPSRLKIDQVITRVEFDTAVKIKAIKLGKKDFFRIRVLYGGLNESLATPQSMSTELNEAAGPMVDFVDNYPPQLIYFPEDKSTFLEESEMSFDWHQRAALHLLQAAQQDVFVHSIYSPNQMLTSRWWLGYLDPRSTRFSKIGEDERRLLWNEVFHMYKRVDDMVGDALDHMAPGSYIVFSSDHGAAPLNQEVRLNNFFAAKGWLKFHFDPRTQENQIDWENTQVVYLNMNHVFINPQGLAGPYQPASGENYERLRDEVLRALQSLKNNDGKTPLAAALPREQAAKWDLPAERVGDLVLANELGFNWVEDVSEDLGVFVAALKSGYKQGILPEKEKALWTPFIVAGPGVKQGYEISRPISHLEQFPTIMKLLNIEPPYKPDREPLSEILVAH